MRYEPAANMPLIVHAPKPGLHHITEAWRSGIRAKTIIQGGTESPATMTDTMDYTSHRRGHVISINDMSHPTCSAVVISTVQPVCS